MLEIKLKTGDSIVRYKEKKNTIAYQIFGYFSQMFWLGPCQVCLKWLRYTIITNNNAMSIHNKWAHKNIIYWVDNNSP